MNEETVMSYYKDQQHRASSDTVVKVRSQFSNESCGDTVVLYVDESGNLRFTGSACSLVFASAEFLCRNVESKDVAIVDIKNEEQEMLRAFGMTPQDKRSACVLLPYRALEVLQSGIRQV